MRFENRFGLGTTFKVSAILAAACWATSAVADPLPPVGSGTLLLQLKADAANVTLGAGNAVTQWNDLSGGARNFTQSTATRQPTWVDSVLNGKPVIRFDGNSDFLQTGTGLNIADRLPFTFFAATTSTTDPFSLFDSAPQVQNPFRFGAFGAGFPTPRNAVEFWDRSPGVGLTLHSNGSVISVTGSRNGTNNRVLEVRESSVDGLVSGSATGNTNPVIFGGNGNPKIGTINNGSGGFYYTGDIAEILIYSGLMTAADRLAVEQYLAHEYNIVEAPVISASPSALGSYGNTVLNAQPVGYWRLETNDTPPNDAANQPGFPQQGPQNGIFQDMNIHDLALAGPRPTDTVGGQPLLGFAADNKAARFKGNASGGNDVVRIADDGNLNMSASQAFTLEAWVKGALAQEDGAAIIAKGPGGGGEQFAVDVVGGKYRFFLWNGGNPNTPTVLQSQITMNPNEWQYVVATFDIGEALMKLYVNGVEVGSVVPPATMVNNLEDVGIGARRSGPGPNFDHNFDGVIDEAAIYAYALSAEEVRAHFDSAFVPVPEPSSMALGVIAAGWLASARRRKVQVK